MLTDDVDASDYNTDWQKSTGGAWIPGSEADVSQHPHLPGYAL